MELHGHPTRLDAFRRGERELLGELYQAYREDVQRTLNLGFTFSSKGKTIRFQGFREPFKCQEVLQECFLRAFKQNARLAYDGTRPWRPYLMAIVRSQVIDHFRIQSTEQRYFVPLTEAVSGALGEHDALERLQSHDALTGSDSPEADALRAQVACALATFLQTRDEQDRHLIQEHLMGDRSQAQIAEDMSLSRNDIRKKIKDLRTDLLRHLKSERLIGELDVADLLQALLWLGGGVA
jgi:RNA polymerase sigma-70 factor (ECF subfamily)